MAELSRNQLRNPGADRRQRRNSLIPDRRDTEAPVRRASNDIRSGTRGDVGGAEALMQPTEARSMLALIDSLPALAVILERPHLRPQLPVIRGDHPTLTAGSHDLVLAERPGSNMSDGTY